MCFFLYSVIVFVVRFPAQLLDLQELMQPIDVLRRTKVCPGEPDCSSSDSLDRLPWDHMLDRQTKVDDTYWTQPWRPVHLTENRLLCIGKEKCPKLCLLPHCAHFPRSLGRRTPSSTGPLKSQDIDFTLLCNPGNAEHVSMLCGGFTNMKCIIKMERTGTLVLFLFI